MMKLKQITPRKKAKGLAAFVLMTTLLYISFYNDPFRDTLKGIESASHQRTHFLVSRLAESSQHGIFSRGGHLLQFKPAILYLPPKALSAKYSELFDGYLTGKGNYNPSDYEIKTSHRCLQCFFYGGIDLGLRKFGIAPAKRLKIMHRGTALLTAATLAVFVLLIAIEFGVGGALLSFLFIASAPIFAWTAPSIYLMVFLWFVPILWCWFYYIYRSPPLNRRRLTIFSLGFFVLIILNCLRGYEFMSSVLISCGAIVVYGLSKDGFRWKQIFCQGSLLVANGVAAFATAVAIHITTSIPGTAAYLFERAKGTTYFNSPNKASVWDVLIEQNMFNKVFALPGFGVGPYILYAGALLAFLLLMVYGKAMRAPAFWRRMEWQGAAALTLFGFLSLVASISWLVLAKNHSYVHALFVDLLWYLSAAIIMPPVLWALGRMVFENWNRKNDEA